MVATLIRFLFATALWLIAAVVLLLIGVGLGGAAFLALSEYL